MPNITPVTNGPLGADVTQFSTTALFTPGTEFRDSGGTVYRYVKSTGILSQYAIGKIDGGHNISNGQLAALLGTTAPLLCGWPQFSGGFTVANQFGWVAVQGPMTILGIATTAPNVLLYCSNVTGGHVTSIVVAPKLNNLFFTGTVGGVNGPQLAFANGYVVTNP